MNFSFYLPGFSVLSFPFIVFCSHILLCFIVSLSSLNILSISTLNSIYRGLLPTTHGGVLCYFPMGPSVVMVVCIFSISLSVLPSLPGLVLLRERDYLADSLIASASGNLNYDL